jgi:hypothetical protein
MTSLFAEWRGEWRLRRLAARYVRAIVAEPSDEDVAWLATTATDGDTDRACWELRYARRGLGLLVAERDALDDRTASFVARRLSEELQFDRRVAAGMVRIAEGQFNERLTAYRDVLSTRNATEGTGVRLGRSLLRSAQNRREPASGSVTRAGEILIGYVEHANAALRALFGEVALPEDRPPSSLYRSATRGR